MQNQVSSTQKMYSGARLSFTLSSCNSFHVQNYTYVFNRIVCLWHAFAGECGPYLLLQISTATFQRSHRSATWLYAPLLFKPSIISLYLMAVWIMLAIDADISCVANFTFIQENTFFSTCWLVSFVIFNWPEAPSHLCNISSIIPMLMGMLPCFRFCLDFFKDDSLRQVTIFLVRCGISAINMNYCFVTGSFIRYLTSKSILGYFSMMYWGNALQNVFVDKVSQYDIQLHPAASNVAILISKLNIGKVSWKAIIIDVMTAEETLLTFTNATISKHLMPGSITLNLKTRCSLASGSSSNIEFCRWFADVATIVESSSTRALFFASATCYGNALNICYSVVMQWVLSPPFSVFVT